MKEKKQNSSKSKILPPQHHVSGTPVEKGFRTHFGFMPEQKQISSDDDITLVAAANNVKKMFSQEKKLLCGKDIVSFTLPKLHKGKSWYVDFFAFDPAKDGMRRKKYMLNHYKTRKERETMATILIHNIYERLIAGWNPFTQGGRTRQYTEMDVVLDRYKSFITCEANKGVMKPKTATDYLSRLKKLKKFLEDEGNVHIKYVYQFDKLVIMDFLDYLMFDNEVSVTTRNNYRTWLSTLCTWMKERMYISENHVESIHMLREGEKFREALSQEALRKLGRYLSENNPPFYLACMMEYYTFIRPNELRYIKIGDISIKEQTVFVSSEASKNRKGQYVALNDLLVKEMIRQHVFDSPSGYYLFGDDLRPGDVQLYTNRLRLEWKKVRLALRFPASYQFYSLKDAGIRDLANAEGIVIARDQARHSDISVTNRYLKAGLVDDKAKHFEGAL